jgi:ribosomal protein S18 acetylase RimI-like enzyme
MKDLLERLTPDSPKSQLIKAIEENYIGYLRGLAVFEGVTWHETEDIIWFRSGLRASWLNRVMRFRYVSDASRVRSTIEVFGDLPFQLFFGPSTNRKVLERHLLAAGMRSMGDEIGMVADLHSLDLSAQSEEIEIQTVADASDARDWSTVLNATFGFSESIGELYYNLEVDAMRRGHPRTSFVGYQHDRPVTVGTLFLHAGVAGVLTIGTIPEVRRGGFGSAMTRFLMQQARAREYPLAVLMASEMGAGVYRKQGFKKVCDFYRYTSEPRVVR